MFADDSNREEQVQRDYADYLAVLKEEALTRDVCGPHCDAYVLHKPGVCSVCDEFPVLQTHRLEHHIAFTGEEPQPDWRPCPATLFREAETIHRWHGNRPHLETHEAQG
jgi:hypothetical protein